VLKFRLKDAAALVLLGMFLFLGWYQSSPPSAIRTMKLTEQSIREEFQSEQRAAAERRATEKRRLAVERLTATAGRIYRAYRCDSDIARITGEIAYDTGVSPRLIAAVVVVESGCNARAVSGRSSVGLMQINPRVWKYTRAQLLDPEFNMRLGVKILKDYVRKFGVVEGLHHYNGLGTCRICLNGPTEYAFRVLEVEGWHVISREEAGYYETIDRSEGVS
jgi:soluble lytic murein transglycosylase-like protein